MWACWQCFKGHVAKVSVRESTHSVRMGVPPHLSTSTGNVCLGSQRLSLSSGRPCIDSCLFAIAAAVQEPMMWFLVHPCIHTYSEDGCTNFVPRGGHVEGVLSVYCINVCYHCATSCAGTKLATTWRRCRLHHAQLMCQYSRLVRHPWGRTSQQCLQ